MNAENDRQRKQINASVDPERAAEQQREAEHERAEARPFDYPYPERRSNVRARRHVSKEDADVQPGIPGGYGTSGGTGVGRNPRRDDG